LAGGTAMAGRAAKRGTAWGLSLRCLYETF